MDEILNRECVFAFYAGMLGPEAVVDFNKQTGQVPKSGGPDYPRQSMNASLTWPEPAWLKLGRETRLREENKPRCRPGNRCPGTGDLCLGGVGGRESKECFSARLTKSKF